MEPEATFRWASTWGSAVACLIACAAVYILIGALGHIITQKSGVANSVTDQIFLGTAADRRIFDASPREALDARPLLRAELNAMMHAICGLMVALGVALLAIAWFGGRSLAPWALWSSLIANGWLVAAYWTFTALPAMRAFQATYGQIFHPYAVVPTALVPLIGLFTVLATRSR